MYGEVFELQATVLKALSHPRRLEIIHLLRDQELSVTDIYSMLDLPQANISQHLMVLREAEIVSTQKKGKQVWYRLANSKIIKASDILQEFVIDLHNQELSSGDTRFKLRDLVPLVHDPVCGMRLSPKTSSFSKHFQAQEYFFCASGCLKTFTNYPEKYAPQK